MPIDPGDHCRHRPVEFRIVHDEKPAKRHLPADEAVAELQESVKASFEQMM
jgi:hypothetical protein